MQWQILIRIYAIILSDTPGQSLWRNNKYQECSISLGLKLLPEKDLTHLPSSGAHWSCFIDSEQTIYM